MMNGRTNTYINKHQKQKQTNKTRKEQVNKQQKKLKLWKIDKKTKRREIEWKKVKQWLNVQTKIPQK